MKHIIPIFASLACFCATSVAWATTNSISINFTSSESTNAVATSASGLSDYGSSHWNEPDRVDNGTGIVLKNNNGVVGDAKLTFATNGAWGSGSSKHTILNGWLDDAKGDIEISISDIPYARYDVIIYYSADWGDYNWPIGSPKVNDIFYTMTETDKFATAIDIAKQTEWGEINGVDPGPILGKNTIRIADQTSKTMTYWGDQRVDSIVSGKSKVRNAVAALQIIDRTGQTPVAPLVIYDRGFTFAPDTHNLIFNSVWSRGMEEGTTYGIKYANGLIIDTNLLTTPLLIPFVVGSQTLTLSSDLPATQTISYAWYYTKGGVTTYSNIYTFQVVAEELEFYLTGDNSIENAVTPSSGEGFLPPTATGVKYIAAPDGRGGAYDLDSTWLIDAGRPTCVNTGSFTVGLWFYKKSTNTGEDAFFGTQNWDSRTNPGFSVNNAGVAYGGADIIPIYDGVTHWQYLTVVVDRDAKSITTYRNGVQVGFATLPIAYDKTVEGVYPSYLGDTMKLLFGDSGTPIATYDSDSYQDEIALWKRPLTANEVNALYNVHKGIVISKGAASSVEADATNSKLTWRDAWNGTWVDGPLNNGTVKNIPVTFDFNDVIVANTITLQGTLPTTFTNNTSATLLVPNWDFSGMTGATTIVNMPISGTITSGANLTLNKVNADTMLNSPADATVSVTGVETDGTPPVITIAKAKSLTVVGPLTLKPSYRTGIDTSSISVSGNVTIDTIGAGGNVWFWAPITGTGSLTVLADDYTWLQDAGGFEGIMTIQGGYLNVLTNSILPTNLTIKDTRLQADDTNVTLASNIHVEGANTVGMYQWYDNTITLTLAGDLTGDKDNASIMPNDGGILELSGNISGYYGILTTASTIQSLKITNTVAGTFPGTIEVKRLLALTNGGDFTFDDVSSVTGAGTITKDGLGKATFTGNKAFTGPINVNAGAFAMSSTQVNTVTLATGTTLALTAPAVSDPTKKPSIILAGHATLDLQGMTDVASVAAITFVTPPVTDPITEPLAAAVLTLDVTGRTLAPDAQLLIWTGEKPAGLTFALTGTSDYFLDDSSSNVVTVKPLLVITVTGGGMLSPNVDSYLTGVIKNNGVVTNVSISADDANKAYVFNFVPTVGNVNPDTGVATATLDCDFSVTRFELTTANDALTAKATVTVVSGATAGVLVAGASLQLTASTTLTGTYGDVGTATSTLTNGVAIFEGVPVGENRFFKAKVVIPTP